MKNFSTSPSQLTEENFNEVKNTSSLLVVKFEASWCGACKMLEPIFQELAGDFAGKATMAKVDIENSSALVVQYHISNLPTLLLFKNGQLLTRHIGVVSKKVLADDINRLLSVESVTPTL